MIDKKVTVEKDGKSLTATYTEELAKDLLEVHGIDVEKELADALVKEIELEFLREKGIEIRGIS